MEELKQINLKDLSIKYKSKKELYDCELYLPPVQYDNAKYIRIIVTGKTKVRVCIYRLE